MRILIGTAICAALIAPSAQSAKTVQEPVLVVSHKTFHVLAWDSGSKLCTELVATGGTASSRAKTVEALFANGATLKLRSAAGRRYHGRRHGRVRFFGGAEKGVTTLAKLTARDAHGHAIQTLKLPATAPPPGPTPQPPTPPPCTPCPPVKNHACPLVACATPTDGWTSSW
jgi:hypothetical protein